MAAQVDSDDYYRQWIYDHESSNILDRVNSIGCVGLGQNCGTALQLACPDWQTNRGCQDIFWNNYAAAYGGWYASYVFWNCTGTCWSGRINQNTYKTATWW